MKQIKLYSWSVVVLLLECPTWNSNLDKALARAYHIVILISKRDQKVPSICNNIHISCWGWVASIYGCDKKGKGTVGNTEGNSDRFYTKMGNDAYTHLIPRHLVPQTSVFLGQTVPWPNGPLDKRSPGQSVPLTNSPLEKRSPGQMVPWHSVLERIRIKSSYLSQWLPQGERGPPKESKSRWIEIFHGGCQFILWFLKIKNSKFFGSLWFFFFALQYIKNWTKVVSWKKKFVPEKKC